MRSQIWISFLVVLALPVSYNSLTHAPHPSPFAPVAAGLLPKAQISEQTRADTSELPELDVQSGHLGPIVATAVSGNGLAATAGEDGTVKVWNATTSQLLRTLRVSQYWVYSVVFSPDNTLLAAGSGDNTVRIWDIATWRQLQELTGHSHAVKQLAFSPDGTRLAAAGARFSSDKQGCLICVWKVDSGERIFQVDRSGEVTKLQFHGNEKLGAALTEGSLPNAWNVDSGEPIGPSDLAQGEEGTASAGGRLSAIGANGRSVAGVTQGTTPPPPLAVRAISVSADGRTVAVGNTNGTLTVWDLQSGQPSRFFDKQGIDENNILHSVGFSPDSKHLFSASWNSGIWFWTSAQSGAPKQLHSPLNKENLDIQRIHAELNPQPNTQPAPPSRLIAVVDGGHLPAIEEVYTAAVSPTGSLIAYGGYSYDDQTRGNFTSIVDWERDQRVDYVLAQPGFGNTTALSFSGNGAAVAVGSEDGNVGIRDLASHSFLQTTKAHAGSVAAVAFSPSGQLVASAGADHLVKIWNLSSGKAISLEGHSGPVFCVAFSHDGSTLASGGADSRIILWDPKTGNKLQTIGTNVSSINALAFSPTQNLLISGSEDGTVTFWGGKPYALLATAVAFGKNQWLVFSPEGFFDGTQLAWQLVPFRFPSEPTRFYQPEQFFNQFYQPNLLADVLASGKSMFQTLRERNDPRANFNVATYRNSSLPNVQITDPGTGGASSDRTIQISIEAEDTGSGLRDLRVFRNQSLVHVEHGDLTPGPFGKFQIVVPIRLSAGENAISAYVFNRDNLKSKDAKIVVTGSANLKRQGTAYIVAIGVNEYSNTAFNLHYAAPDAEAFSQTLSRSLSELKTYEKVVPVLLLDAEATKKNIQAALNRLAGADEETSSGLPTKIKTLQAAQPEDAVLIYFAGHGAALGERYYLIPHDIDYQGDTKQIDVQARLRILKSGLSDLDFQQAIEKIDSSRILFVIDACQSGQILEAEEKRRGPMNSRGLAQLAYEKGAYVLAAAQSYQAAMEFKRLGHGVLTYVLLEDALTNYKADTDQDGLITASEWLQYATREVPIEVQALENERLRVLGRDVDYGEISVTGQAPRSYFRQDLDEKWTVASKQK
ncbi:MAG TPA: caspase family protein [Candidatus Sulfotelmatobacter sp.]|nr:caspase family protein [Candidatus Sulfotelmatobacter sp.]